MMQAMLLRLAYLAVTNTLSMLRLLPMGDRDKDIEILALRHQITVLERQLHGDKPQFTPADRAFLAALLHRPPVTCCTASGCWSAPTPSCAGTAISSRTTTRTGRGPNAPAAHRPFCPISGASPGSRE
jgi:hypothetical protein